MNDDLYYSAASQFIEGLDSILSAVHYTVTGDILGEGDNRSILLSVTCDDPNEEMLPTISFEFVEYEQEYEVVWYANPALSFPDLAYIPGESNSRDIEYWTSRWSEIGEAISYSVSSFSLNYTRYIMENDSFDDVESATEIMAHEDVEVRPGDEEIIYEDCGDVFGETGDEISLASIKQYWNENKGYDPSLHMYSSFDDWFSDTKSNYLRSI